MGGGIRSYFASSTAGGGGRGVTSLKDLLCSFQNSPTDNYYTLLNFRADHMTFVGKAK